MSSVVGSLIVKLSAHTAQFGTGLKWADKMASVSMRSITSSFGRMFTKTNMLLTTLAGAGLTAIIKRQMEAIDSTAKMSQRLGVGVRELSRFHYAAKLSGIETRTFNMGLQRMTRRVAEAAMGTGEAQGAIKSLGLDAKKLGAMTPDKIFYEIASAMEKVPTQGERVRLAFKMFDSEGVAMVQMLRKGKEGLVALGIEADKTGASFSELDAKQIEAANDAIIKMGASFSGLFNKLSIELAPFIKMLADDLAVGIANAGKAAKDSEQSYSSMTTFMFAVADSAQTLYEYVSKAWLVYAKFAKWSWEGDLNFIDRMMGDTDESQKEWREFWGKAISDTERDLNAMGKGNWSDTLKKRLATFKSQLQESMAKSASGGAAAEQLDAITKEYDKWLQKINEIGKTEEQVSLQRLRDLGATAEQLGTLNVLMARFKEYTEASNLGNATQSFIDDLNKRIDSIGKTADEVRLEDLIIAGLSPKKEKQIRAMMEALSGAVTPKTKFDFTGAMQRGSVEAYSTIVNDRRGSKEKEQTAIMKKTLSNEEKQTALQKMIAENTRSKPIPVGI